MTSPIQSLPTPMVPCLPAAPSGTAEFGDFKLVSAGMQDIFVLRLSANGTPTWAFRAGGPGDDDALALVADDNGSLYLGGSIMQTADFGPYLLSAKGSKDGFLLSLDYGGNVQWVGSLLSTEQAELRDLVLDSMDRPVVAGDFSGLVEFRGTRLANDGSSPIVWKDSEATSTISDLSSGLVAWYPFDGNASDMSGNGNHGTVYGATLIPDLHGYPDQAYDFDGSDWIEVSHSPSINFASNDPFSLSLWLKLGQGNSGYRSVIEKNAAGNSPFFIRYHNSYGIYFRSVPANDDDVLDLNGYFNNLSEFAFVAFTGDGNSLKSYANGRFSNSETIKVSETKTKAIFTLANTDTRTPDS